MVMIYQCLYMADVIAIWVADVVATFCFWQMLWPYLADVVAILLFLADVIANCG